MWKREKYQVLFKTACFDFDLHLSRLNIKTQNMKKAILLVCGLFVAVAVQAQDKKMWLSGTLGINSVNPNVDGDTKISTMTFGPQFGYMINENIAIGLNVGLSNTKTTEGFESVGDIDGDGFEDGLAYDEKTESQVLVGPFVRYYKMIGDNFGLYGELNIGIGSGTTSWDGVSFGGNEVEVDDVKFSTLNVGVGPGFQYWFNDNWSVNAQMGLLGYTSRNDKDGTIDENGDTADLKSTQFDLNLNFSRVNFAFNFHF